MYKCMPSHCHMYRLLRTASDMPHKVVAHITKCPQWQLAVEGEGFETGIGEMSLILRLSQVWKGILQHLQQEVRSWHAAHKCEEWPQ